MSEWYRDFRNLMEGHNLDESDAPYNVVYEDGEGRQRMRFDDEDEARAFAIEHKGMLWLRDTFIADYEHHEGGELEEADDMPDTLEAPEETPDEAPSGPEPCIPRIGVYRDEGPNGRTKLSYEVLLFFPAAEANRYKIVYYAHVGQHGEASYDFFAQNTLKPTVKNLAKAGVTQQDFDHLIKEWENLGPEHTPVKLYMRDQDSFRKSRWDWDRQQR